MTKAAPLNVLRLAFCSGLTTFGFISIFLWISKTDQNSYWLDGLSFNAELVKQPYFLPIVFLAASSLVMSFILPSRIAAAIVKSGSSTNPKITAEIIRMAILESVGLFGLVLGMLSQRYLISLPFIVIAIVFILRPLGDKSAAQHAGRELY